MEIAKRYLLTTQEEYNSLNMYGKVYVLPPETAKELEGYVCASMNIRYPLRDSKTFKLPPNYQKSDGKWYYMFEKKEKIEKYNKRYYFTEDELISLYAKDTPEVEKRIKKFNDARESGNVTLVYAEYTNYDGRFFYKTKEWLLKYAFDEKYVYNINYDPFTNIGKHHVDAKGYHEIYTANVPKDVDFKTALKLLRTVADISNAKGEYRHKEFVSEKKIRNAIYNEMGVDVFSVNMQHLIFQFNEDMYNEIVTLLTEEGKKVIQELEKKGIIVTNLEKTE